MLEFTLLYILSILSAGMYAVIACDRGAPNNVVAIITFCAFIPYLNTVIGVFCLIPLIWGGILCVREKE